jgi:[CysO sulfur-carrier protein]-S-L-cysteine hydrolase
MFSLTCMDPFKRAPPTLKLRKTGFFTARGGEVRSRMAPQSPRGKPGVARGDTQPRLDVVLTIDQETYDAIVAHAKRDHPDEACGVVAGPVGSDRPERLVEMVNAAGSPTFYEFDSLELLALYKDMDARDEEPVVIYHSHTATEAYPSRTDIGLASEPNAHYVLVSTREHGNNEGPVEFRSYRIQDGEVTEEEVAVVPAQESARRS